MFRALTPCGLALFLAAQCLGADSPWPAIASDLPNDPALRQGVLPNGLHYAVLPNGEPKNRVSLRFLVKVGSLHENDDERGLAHFAEHMAFRSTRAYPSDSMISALQHQGFALGPDSGAFTLPDYTIYHLELPDAQESTLLTGLRVFREFADGVTFDKQLIERERGVILSEKAMHDTPDARAFNANQAFLWPRSRYVQRVVIGTEKAIRSVTRAQFVAFYKAWYRPERMAVVAVGDIDAEMVVRALTQTFSSLSPRGKARPEPADMVARQAAPPAVNGYVNPGLIGMMLTFEHPSPMPRTPDTHGQRVRQLHEELAFAMFQRRLTKISRQDNETVVTPTARLFVPIPEWRIAEVTVAGAIKNWQAIAAAIEQEHRRVFLHGFTVQELAVARANFVTGYEEATRTASTRRSEYLAAQLAGSLLYGVVFATPAVQQRDLAADLAAATPRDCLEAFRAVWTQQPPHVFAQANPAFDIKRSVLTQVLNDSRKTEVTPPVEASAQSFAYTDFGPPGQLVSTEHAADLDVRLAEFANGVKFNFKSTTFEADTVHLYVRIGDGLLSQPENLPGLNWLANLALTAGGLRKHSTEELNELLAGHAVSVRFGVDPDACVFTARCARRDLELGLQIIAAYLTDAAFRRNALRDAHAWYGTHISQLMASPGGPINLLAFRTLLLRERRFGLPQYEEFASCTIEELVNWLQPQFQHGPIELSIVGDTTWDEAATAAGRTLGALARREPRRDPGDVTRIRFAYPDFRPTVFTIEPRFKQSALAWYWPVPEPVDTHQERRSHLLAMIVADRLRVRLRDELGAAYAPTAYFVATDAFSSLNYFSLYAEVNGAHTQKANEIIKRELVALGEKGLREEEFLRAKQPYLRSMADERATNAYWSGIVLRDAQQRPERLAAARDRIADLESITREEVVALARRYLKPEQGFMFVAEAAPLHFWGQK